MMYSIFRSAAPGIITTGGCQRMMISITRPERCGPPKKEEARTLRVRRPRPLLWLQPFGEIRPSPSATFRSHPPTSWPQNRFMDMGSDARRPSLLRPDFTPKPRGEMTWLSLRQNSIAPQAMPPRQCHLFKKGKSLRGAGRQLVCTGLRLPSRTGTL